MLVLVKKKKGVLVCFFPAFCVLSCGMEVLQYVPLSPTFCGSSQANRPPGLTVKPTAAKQFASAIRQHKKYAQGRQLGVKVGYRTCKTPSVVHRGHPCREILLEPCHRFVIALKRERKKLALFLNRRQKRYHRTCGGETPTAEVVTLVV